jgi:hypothetical protein
MRQFPVSVHLLFAVYAACFLGAAFGHARDIWLGGWLPYTYAPLAVNAYWTSLTVLDVLAVVLLYAWPRAGLTLALLIMLSDVAINSYVCYVLNGGQFADVSLQLQTLFLGFLLGSVPFAWRRVGGRG